MKVTYYKYWLKSGTARHHHNLEPFLAAFASISDARFKNSFHTPEGDNLYLFPMANSIYLFAITRDRELIRAINSRSLSHEDIQERLAQDDHVGFSSYVYIGDCFIGLASTVLSPKTSRFIDFVNDILQRARLDQYAFDCEAFPTKLTPSAAKKLKYKYAVRMTVKHRHPLFDLLAERFNSDDIAQIVIEMRPSPRDTMNETADAIIEAAKTDPGIHKMMVRARAELDDLLTDYYIVGNGAVSSPLEKGPDQKIALQLAQDVSSNAILKKSIRAFRSDNAFAHDDIPGILPFNQPDNWSAVVARTAPGLS